MRCWLALPLLAGCAGGGWEGIWLLTVPYVDEEDACTTTVTENFTDGEVPPDEDPVGPWTYEDTLETSDTLLVAEVLEAKGNNVLLVLLDQVYTGTFEGGVLTVGWTDRTVDHHGEDHEAGYTFTEDDTTETVETFTLERNGEVDGATGRFVIESLTELVWTESDEWPVGQTNVYATKIPSFVYLEGPGAVSQPNAAECEGGTCSLEVRVQCTLGGDVTALYVGKDRDGTYAAIENAGQ